MRECVNLYKTTVNLHKLLFLYLEAAVFIIFMMFPAFSRHTIIYWPQPEGLRDELWSLRLKHILMLDHNQRLRSSCRMFSENKSLHITGINLRLNKRKSISISPCCADYTRCWRRAGRARQIAWSCWKPETGIETGAEGYLVEQTLSQKRRRVEFSPRALLNQSCVGQTDRLWAGLSFSNFPEGQAYSCIFTSFSALFLNSYICRLTCNPWFIIT